MSTAVPAACRAEHTHDGVTHACGREFGHTSDHHAGPGTTWPAALGQNRRISLGVNDAYGRHVATHYPDGSAVMALTIGGQPAELHLDRNQRAELIGALLRHSEVAVPDETFPEAHVVRSAPPRGRPGAHRRAKEASRG